MITRLHQMNISYMPAEDRLLLKVSSRSGEEYRLWLTRRYTGLLVNVLQQEFDRSGGKQVIAASADTTRMYREGAFEKTYEDQCVDYPLGEEGILAFRINLSRLKNGNLKLEMGPQQGQGLSLNLNKSMLYMFNNLLNQGIDQAGWNLPTGERISSRVH